MGQPVDLVGQRPGGLQRRTPWTSDVVLIGAGTFRAERYRPMLARVDDAESRAAAGQAPAPVVTIVSGSARPAGGRADLRRVGGAPDRRDDRFGRPGATGRGPAARRRDGPVRRQGRPRRHGQPARGPRPVAHRLRGGARLLATISQDGLLDEVDITMSPMMSRGGQVSTGTGTAWPRAFPLTQVIAAPTASCSTATSVSLDDAASTDERPTMITLAGPGRALRRRTATRPVRRSARS